MSYSEFLSFAVFALLGGVVGYSMGKSRGWFDAISKCFHPFFAEGYYNGWAARHHGAVLEDTRVHPDELRRLVPSLTDAGQEICHWMRHGDHVPFEQYRQEQVAALNGELERERHLKHAKPEP